MNSKRLFVIILLMLTNMIRAEIINWSFKTNDKIYSKPIVTSDAVYFGSLDKHFYALDIETGAELWQFPTSATIQSNATIKGDTLLFESGNTLYCLNKETGEKIWEFASGEKASEMIDPWDYYHSSPYIDGNHVYFGSGTGDIYGLKIKNGEEIFHAQSINKAAVRTTVLVSDSVIYFGDWNGKVYAVDMASGKQKWVFSTFENRPYSSFGAISSPIKKHGNKLFFGARNDHLFALNAETGEAEWTWVDGIGSWMSGEPVFIGDTLIIGGSDNHKIFAFNTQTGDLIWQTKLDYNIFSSPLIFEDYLYVATGNCSNQDNPSTSGHTSFCIIDKKTGQIRSRLKTETNIFSAPSYYNETIFLANDNGNLLSIDQPAFLDDEKYFVSNIIIDQSNLFLGTINATMGVLDTSITICNYGFSGDTISVEFSCPGISSDSALYSHPKEFYLPGNDSIRVTITVDPRYLQANFYIGKINISSAKNVSGEALSKMIYFTITAPTSVDKSNAEKFHLYQNYPNPFNPVTNIKFSLERDSFVNLSIFDIKGNLVETLVNKKMQTGHHITTWNSENKPSGIYFYRLKTKKTTLIRDCLLMK